MFLYKEVIALDPFKCEEDKKSENLSSVDIFNHVLLFYLLFYL